MTSTFKYGDVEITFLKHAGFKIKGSKTIYIDPYDLPDIELERADLVLVTHEHFDHMDLKAIKKVRKDETVVVVPSGCMAEGYRTCELDIGVREEVEGVTIETVPAYNVDKSFHRKGEGVGYIVTIDGVRIYHAGDTDFIPEMKEIDVDIALIPVGGVYTMDVEDAKKAIDVIKAKHVIPMHYGTLPETKADLSKLKLDKVVVLEPMFK